MARITSSASSSGRRSKRIARTLPASNKEWGSQRNAAATRAQRRWTDCKKPIHPSNFIRPAIRRFCLASSKIRYRSFCFASLCVPLRPLGLCAFAWKSKKQLRILGATHCWKSPAPPQSSCTAGTRRPCRAWSVQEGAWAGCSVVRFCAWGILKRGCGRCRASRSYLTIHVRHTLKLEKQECQVVEHLFRAARLCRNRSIRSAS